MDIMQAVRERHSVRSFTEQKIEGDALNSLKQEIADCNMESGLNIQLVLNEPTAFDSYMARHSGFKGAVNYIALIGKKGDDLQEKCGYYGEKIALKAQMLGLNTCWVAQTFKKRFVRKLAGENEKLICVIVVGYGVSCGLPHKNRSIDPLCKFNGDMPHWFMRGMDSAMLAPTALNQQKFCFTLLGDDRVKAEPTGGVYSRVDLGIVKYHFLIAAGEENFNYV